MIMPVDVNASLHVYFSVFADLYPVKAETNRPAVGLASF
jgi:hypothetical protein